MDQGSETAHPQPATAARDEKEPYETPKLSRYGDLQELTAAAPTPTTFTDILTFL
jgi:hypothetical protein